MSKQSNAKEHSTRGEFIILSPPISHPLPKTDKQETESTFQPYLNHHVYQDVL